MKRIWSAGHGLFVLVKRLKSLGLTQTIQLHGSWHLTPGDFAIWPSRSILEGSPEDLNLVIGQDHSKTHPQRLCVKLPTITQSWGADGAI